LDKFDIKQEDVIKEYSVDSSDDQEDSNIFSRKIQEIEDERIQKIKDSNFMNKFGNWTSREYYFNSLKSKKRRKGILINQQKMNELTGKKDFTKMQTVLHIEEKSRSRSSIHDNNNKNRSRPQLYSISEISDTHKEKKSSYSRLTPSRRKMKGMLPLSHITRLSNVDNFSSISLSANIRTRKDRNGLNVKSIRKDIPNAFTPKMRKRKLTNMSNMTHLEIITMYNQMTKKNELMKEGERGRPITRPKKYLLEGSLKGIQSTLFFEDEDIFKIMDEKLTNESDDEEDENYEINDSFYQLSERCYIDDGNNFQARKLIKDWDPKEEDEFRFDPEKSQFYFGVDHPRFIRFVRESLSF
jgi:hypothetical protein